MYFFLVNYLYNWKLWIRFSFLTCFVDIVYKSQNKTIISEHMTFELKDRHSYLFGILSHHILLSSCTCICGHHHDIVHGLNMDCWHIHLCLKVKGWNFKDRWAWFYKNIDIFVEIREKYGNALIDRTFKFRFYQWSCQFACQLFTFSRLWLKEYNFHFL